MIMRLLKDGIPILSARSQHTERNAGSDLPIFYEGDTSLLPDEMECISVDSLEGIFSRIAHQEGFDMDGDYRPMIRKGEVVLPPADHPWWARNQSK